MARRKLNDLRALVTGASSGIGREIARELARRGVHLMLFARREQRLRELADELLPLGVKVGYVAGDVTNPHDRRSALAVAHELLGGLDVLVNNAGITARGPFLEADSKRLRQIFEVNFFAAAEMIREAAPLLREGQSPIVVNIGSILGRRAIPGNSEYCASKFALHGLSESLRMELVPLGIGLLIVAPGSTDTELFDRAIERRGPLPWYQRKGASPERVAKATVRAIEKGRRLVFPQRRVWLLDVANRFFPSVIDRLLTPRKLATKESD